MNSLEPKKKIQVKRILSKKYAGVYHRDTVDNDRVYEFTYKDLEGKKRWVKVGNMSDNFSEVDAYRKRLEAISKIKLDGDEANFIKKRRVVKKLTLNAVANLYFKDYESRAKEKIFKESLAKYEKKVEPTFGKLAVVDITKDMISKWLKSFQKEYKDASIKSYYATLNVVLNYGINNIKELENFSNPAQKIKIKEPQNERERILSTNEIEHIFACLIHKPKALLYISVALGTGARPAAIIDTKKKDLDQVNKLITFNALKHGERYSVPLTDDLYELLRNSTKDLQSNDYIFHPDIPKKIPERAITYEGIKGQIQPLLDELYNKGLDSNDRKHRVTLYTFRHTFATHLVKSPNVNLLDVKKLMSHSRLQMTERYAKVELHEGTKTALDGLYKK